VNGIEKYCRQVSQKLTARRSTRRQLLDGLAAEITDTLGEGCSESEIIAAFGPPERAAEELQLTVGGAEQEGERRLWKRSHLLLALLCVALAAAICALVWFFTNNRVRFADNEVINFEEGAFADETSLVSCSDGGPAAVDGGLRIC
jgi:hypothetical protein